jgi:hypothetical protein
VLESKEIYVERGQAVTADFGCGGAVPQPAGRTTTSSARGEVLGQRFVSGTSPAAASDKKAKTKKKAGRRAACLRKAANVKSKAQRKAAVKRCSKRYPANAKVRTPRSKRR